MICFFESGAAGLAGAGAAAVSTAIGFAFGSATPENRCAIWSRPSSETSGLATRRARSISAPFAVPWRFLISAYAS